MSKNFGIRLSKEEIQAFNQLKKIVGVGSASELIRVSLNLAHQKFLGDNFPFTGNCS